MYGKTNSVVTKSDSQNTLKKLLDATKNCSYLFQEYSGVSVDDLIQPNDTENVTTMSSMFYNCNNLTTIPQLNTGKVTKMNSMFYNCSKLPTIPLLNTSNVTTMSSIFFGCNDLITISQLDTGKVTNMSGAFYNCNNLQTVPAFDCSNVTNMNNIFSSCSSLKSVLMTNIGVSLDISASTLFERADLVTILNNLKTVTTTKTLTMGATNLAKLTDEDKAIATNKGWTLA